MNVLRNFSLCALAVAFLCSTAVVAQTNINLGGFTADSTAPIEITSDALSVDQDTGTAKFSGNVFIGQGALRLSAGEVEVVYAEEAGQIARLLASGGVTFVTETEAAEATTAEYNLETGMLVLSGDVLLTQGPSAISAQRMSLNLTTGNAELSGQVRTILQQGDN